MIATLATGCGESGQRMLKDFTSDFGGGLDRTLTVYDYNGQPIKTYEGKFDIRTGDGAGKVLFDINGKRTIIHGGIIIVDEK